MQNVSLKELIKASKTYKAKEAQRVRIESAVAKANIGKKYEMGASIRDWYQRGSGYSYKMGGVIKLTQIVKGKGYSFAIPRDQLGDLRQGMYLMEAVEYIGYVGEKTFTDMSGFNKETKVYDSITKHDYEYQVKKRLD